MLRRTSRSLFVARNRALLQASSRAVGKGATNPNIVGSSQAPQDVDPAGQQPLQFGKHDRESAMFSHAAGAWDAMRKVGQANPIEKSIERFEDRYQTAGTGADRQHTPSLWERAKEAVHNIKDSITHTTAKAKDKVDLSTNPSRDDEIIAPAATPIQRSTLTQTESTEDFTIQRTQEQSIVGDQQFVAQGETVFSKGARPHFRDDATGHRPWNWEMANDSIRNSTDGMGIIEPVGPSAADYERMHSAHDATDTKPQTPQRVVQQNQLKSGTQQDWEAGKSSTRQDFQNLKQAAATETAQKWDQTKSDLKQNWTEAKNQMKDNVKEATADLKQNYEAAKDTVAETWNQKKQDWQQNKDIAKENLRESTEGARESWEDTKAVAKEGIREAGKQLKQGMQDIKEGVKSGFQAASTTSPQPGMTKPQRVEQSYEEFYNRPPGQRAQAAADQLMDKKAKDETRLEVEKESSPEHDEKNAQVPKKEPTRYGDFESGGRATDF